MTATCPNDSAHERFSTTAHVLEEWIVDRKGNYLGRTDCLEVTHQPNPGNTWTCSICGAEAKVKP